MYSARRRRGKLPILVTVTYKNGKVEWLMFNKHSEHLKFMESVYEGYDKGNSTIKDVSVTHASF